MSSGQKKIKTDINIRFCGIGGMGVISMSIILGKAAIYDKKNAAQTQSYGAEQRGSKVKSDIIISDKEMISYPIIEKADVLVALSQDAFEVYFPTTRKDGIILINSDLVNIYEELNHLYKIPATKLALELNNKKVANLIMLGSLVKVVKIISKDSILKSIIETFPKKYKDQNIQAFQRGFEYINS